MPPTASTLSVNFLCGFSAPTTGQLEVSDVDSDVWAPALSQMVPVSPASAPDDAAGDGSAASDDAQGLGDEPNEEAEHKNTARALFDDQDITTV